MIPSTVETEPLPWVALVVRPRLERKVETGLSQAGIESFIAWHGVRKRWSDRVKVVHENLFPGYIFCRSTFDDRNVVMRQPGVEWVVSFNHAPALIPHHEIDAVRRMISSGLPFGPWPFLKTGQRVRVERGVLAGVEGILARDCSSWRVALTVDALERSVAVEVDRDMIRPIPVDKEKN